MDAASRNALTPISLRTKAKDFALKAVDAQREQFKRYGIWGAWEEPYMTMQPEYEAAQVGVFGRMFLNGHIYRGRKPVNWSPSSQTALAEAELEYPEARTHPPRSSRRNKPAGRAAALTGSAAASTTAPHLCPLSTAAVGTTLTRNDSDSPFHFLSLTGPHLPVGVRHDAHHQRPGEGARGAEGGALRRGPGHLDHHAVDHPGQLRRRPQRVSTEKGEEGISCRSCLFSHFSLFPVRCLGVVLASGERPDKLLLCLCLCPDASVLRRPGRFSPPSATSTTSWPRSAGSPRAKRRCPRTPRCGRTHAPATPP